MDQILKIGFTACLAFMGSVAMTQVLVDTFEGIDTVIVDDGLVQGPDGVLYGAHYNGDRIYKIFADGSAEIFATGITAPNGMDFDSEGNLFVADNLGHKILKITADGTVSEHVTAINRPSGILKMRDSDTLLVTRYATNIIVKIAPDGHIDTLSQGGLLDGPVGLAYDDEGNLFTSNFNNRRLISIQPDGSQSLFSQFPGPGYLGFMTYGNGYFFGTGFDTHKVFKIRQSDTLISALAGAVMGEVDGDTSVALFNRPNGIALNASKDTLFISAYGTGNVRVITGFNGVATIEKLMVSSKGMLIYPNPAQHVITLQFELYQADEVTLRLLDFTGQCFKTKRYNAVKGKNRLNWSAVEIPAGHYLVELNVGGECYYKKFIKLN